MCEIIFKKWLFGRRVTNIFRFIDLDVSSDKTQMVPIDEDLFEDEDLDDLEDDLTSLDV